MHHGLQRQAGSEPASENTKNLKQNQDLIVVGVATSLIVLPDTNETQAATIAEDSRKTFRRSTASLQRRGRNVVSALADSPKESAAENDDVEMTQ